MPRDPSFATRQISSVTCGSKRRTQSGIAGRTTQRRDSIMSQQLNTIHWEVTS